MTCSWRFLGSYVPKAFDEALHCWDTTDLQFDIHGEPRFRDKWPVKVTPSASQLEKLSQPCESSSEADTPGVPSEGVSAAAPSSDTFAAQNDSSASGQRLAIERAHKMWLVSNFSLVVPVILAMLVLYLAFAYVREETKQLTQREDDLLNDYKSQTTNLEKLNLELFKLLKAGPSPTPTNKVAGP
jgi:hypothetical protein